MEVGLNSHIIREVSGKGFSLDELGVSLVELNFDDAPVLDKNGINGEILKNLLGLGVDFTVHAPTSDGKRTSVDLGRYSRGNIITMKNVLKIASELNAKVLVLHGGDIRKGYHEAYINTMKQVEELSSLAQDYGVRLVMENLTGSRIGVFPHEITSFREYGVSTCIDTGHAFLTAFKLGYPLEKFLLPDVLEVHIHDNHGRWDEHLPPGEGLMGWGYVERLIKNTEPDYAILEIRRFSSLDSVKDSIKRLQGDGR
ncbi:AP endonuclease [Thermococcus sp. P6]|uniref:sugar phosphate isomerase/epimerase family protein n=1 Tax=Thermococcus sp. P6 TaxID=122420 RepID=UPI000B5A1C9A|nr:sugar phosphate isomerase/epimerase family protein [Thermococcus sp. P6]ASJ09809.1 AP endonuclease [Thermococcus sp. P6]